MIRKLTTYTIPGLHHSPKCLHVKRRSRRRGFTGTARRLFTRLSIYSTYVINWTIFTPKRVRICHHSPNLRAAETWPTQRNPLIDPQFNCGLTQLVTMSVRGCSVLRSSCLSVCLSVCQCSRVYFETRRQTSRDFHYMKPMAVVWSSLVQALRHVVYFRFSGWRHICT